MDGGAMKQHLVRQQEEILTRHKTETEAAAEDIENAIKEHDTATQPGRNMVK